MSDYYQRYQKQSHAELYAQLKAGNPDQIDGLVSDWVSMEQTLDSLAQSLASDLDRLDWDSASGQEFRRRIGVINAYTRTLSGEFRSLHEGLSMMSGPLREAQSKAESPEETDDNDQAIKGAVKGALVGGLPGAVVGGIFGHKQDEEEKEKAHQRMVQLVAGLAADYDLNGERSWTNPTPIPESLPGASPTSCSTPSAGPGTRSVSAAPSSGGSGGGDGHQIMSLPGTVSAGPTTGDGVPEQGMGPAPVVPEVTTSLAGVGDGGGNGLLGAAWAAGGIGLLTAAGGGARNSGTSSSNGTNLLGTPGEGLAGTGRGALDGGRSAMGPANRTGRTPDLGVRSGDGNRAATGNRAAAGHRETDDEQDERLTWLTEDEMVWQGKENAPPPVLGNF